MPWREEATAVNVRVLGVFHADTLLSVVLEDGPDLLKRAETKFRRSFRLSLHDARSVLAVSGDKRLSVRTWDYDQVADELGGHEEIV